MVLAHIGKRPPLASVAREVMMAKYQVGFDGVGKRRSIIATKRFIGLGKSLRPDEL
jgi:hypothetical protein